MFARSLMYQKDYSFFLFGPRGTGKSTWVKQKFPDAVYIDLLKDSVFSDLLSNPSRLEGLCGNKKNQWIIIDEVQKLPSILDEVHSLIENEKRKFILTGSSTRKLKRSGANLLAGRARTLEMHPLTANELGEAFNLSHALLFGGLPSTYTVKDPKEYLSGYIGTYLKEEVQQESLVRNLGNFAKFLEAASFSQAAVLNIQNVAKECGVKRKSVENYFTLLEDLLLSVRLPIFSRRAKRKMAYHPKFYFFDAGVYRALRPRGPLDPSEEIDGAAIETLVFQELRATNANLNLDYKMFFWRTEDKHEVDFILYGERGLWGIEVKRSSRFRDEDLHSMKLFLEDYPQAKGIFLYGGEKTYQFDRLQVLPLEYGLKHLSSII